MIVASPNPKIGPVILSGGSGTRLWPMSRKAHPKQFHAITGDMTLFEQTLERAAVVSNQANPIVICNEAHLPLVDDQLDETTGIVILEPNGRNTAPAVAAAALVALESISDEDDPLLLILPADHIVKNIAAFEAAVSAGIEAAYLGYLVTFGIVPGYPETGYGYLRCGDRHGTWFELDQFVEKPDAATAAQYIDSGQYLWNSGMFLLSARAYLNELEQHAPPMLTATRTAVEQGTREGRVIRLGDAFIDCPADSIDYAVMEKTKKAAAVPLDAQWSDVGSWSAVHEALANSEGSNHVSGDVLTEDVNNSLIIGGERLIGVVGLDDIVVVDTNDAVLVMSKSEAQRLKQLVDRVEPAKK